jgi:monoamine oxidase
MLIGTTGFVARNSFAGVFLSPKFEKCDCVVIGAGMAGLIAARDLSFPKYARKGYKTILLEASGRIGGRIHTVEDPRFGGPLEMGAEYIHRDPGTVALWNEVDKYKPKIEKISRMFKGLMYYEGWEDHLKKYYALVKEWNLYDILTFSHRIDSYRGPDISAKQWIERQRFDRIGRNLVDLYFTGHVPGSLAEMSLKGFISDRISEQEMGWNEYQFEDGYSDFLNQLVLGVDQHRGKQIDIRFHSFVKYIKYGKSGTEVHTTDGRIFLAQAVILTASVGMLKSGDICFNPPLPQDKIDALNCMGMGDEAKIVLKFNKRFWPKDAVFINRIDNQREMSRTYFVPFVDDPAKDKVLCILFAGDEADKIKNMTDMEVIQALCRDFDKMFPSSAPTFNLLEKDRVTQVITYLRWQWSNDSFSKGADSFLKVGFERSIPIEKVRKALAHPASTPGLFWAGEATVSSEYTQPCSTHGAHFSGARAAIEVGEYLRTKLIV